MEVRLEIPEYSPDTAMKYNWEPGFDIGVRYENGVIFLTANREGLFSLTNHFLNLSQEKTPEGYHLHFDENNSLEEGSVELIIQKNEKWFCFY